MNNRINDDYTKANNINKTLEKLIRNLEYATDSNTKKNEEAISKIIKNSSSFFDQLPNDCSQRIESESLRKKFSKIWRRHYKIERLFLKGRLRMSE